MRTLLFLFVFLPASLQAVTSNTEDAGHQSARGIYRALRSGGLDELAVQTDATLDSILRVALVNMRAKGDLYWRDADQIEWRWQHTWKGELVRAVRERRDIGDHAPLILWLEQTYDVIEFALGVEVCKALHLSDIKSLNCGIPVVFRPTSFPMDSVTIPRVDEYRNHFNRGAVYYGVAPVLTWWGISIGCWAGTSGFGAFLCSIAASAGEWLMAHTLGPKLSDWVYHAAGGT